MEIAIPLIALGGMYVVSNQPAASCETKKKKINEGFNNAGASRNYLPNANPPQAPQNYPVTRVSELVDNVAEFVNPNAATDKYFNQSFYEKQQNAGKKVGQNPQQIYSLTGNYVDSAQFKHSNMMPFNGGKVKGQTYDMNIAETLLDNMMGNGSQVIKKIEQAPLFKPQDNVQWTYGTPNMSDFYQSRVNPGMRSNNVKPFATENVGPGLNQGYTTTGSGGFNSGMESRDSWLPKTVDELRVTTNPKLEYTLDNHEGPANSVIKNVGILGRVEKQRPDTFFMNTQDRWLTTTGLEKGETLRPLQEMGIVRRPDCEVNYPGPAGQIEKTAGYVPTAFEESKRNTVHTYDVPHSSAAGRGPVMNQDNALKGYANYNNHRSTVRQSDTMRSGFGGAIGAVIAPLMDVLRPSRKEEVVSNLRVYGEAGTAVPSSYVLNPQDVTPTTVKETTMYSPHFNINNQKEGQYVNTYTPMDLTQRDTTSCETFGSMGGQGSQYGNMNYEAAYRQHNNDIKAQTIHNRTNQGNMNLFNTQMNVSISRQDEDRYGGRVAAPSSVIKMPPAKENYGKINVPQYNNECYGCERIQPDILDAFRSNPYTHSLTTSV